MLTIYSFVTPPSESGSPELSDLPKSLAVYFGGKRVGTVTSGTTFSFAQDRLGSNGSYYPYGEARGTVPQDDVGYATYTNDSATGLEYADQRYYASNFGRFMSPDRRGPRSGGKPVGWNRYTYVLGDPINLIDKFGLDPEKVDDGDDDGGDDGGDDGSDGSGDDFGGGGGGAGPTCGPDWMTDPSLSGPCCPTSGGSGFSGDPTPQPPNPACYAPAQPAPTKPTPPPPPTCTLEVESRPLNYRKRQTNPSERRRTLVLSERGFSRAVGLG